MVKNKNEGNYWGNCQHIKHKEKSTTILPFQCHTVLTKKCATTDQPSLSSKWLQKYKLKCSSIGIYQMLSIPPWKRVTSKLLQAHASQNFFVTFIKNPKKPQTPQPFSFHCCFPIQSEFSQWFSQFFSSIYKHNF